MKRHRCAPGNYPGTSVVAGTHRTRKTNVSQGNWKDLATNFAALTTSAYSNSCVLQGHEPPTSATLTVGITTRPHWPLAVVVRRYYKVRIAQWRIIEATQHHHQASTRHNKNQSGTSTLVVCGIFHVIVKLSKMATRHKDGP